MESTLEPMTWRTNSRANSRQEESRESLFNDRSCIWVTSKTRRPTPKEMPERNFPVVPTTKILAIGQFTKPPTPEQIKEIFPREVPATLRLYLAGKIDQWWIRQTQTGPVFLLNVTSLEEARTLMEELPLGQAGLMKHEFIELGPLTPLHLLLTNGGPTASE